MSYVIVIASHANRSFQFSVPFWITFTRIRHGLLSADNKIRNYVLHSIGLSSISLCVHAVQFLSSEKERIYVASLLQCVRSMQFSFTILFRAKTREKRVFLLLIVSAIARIFLWQIHSFIHSYTHEMIQLYVNGIPKHTRTSDTQRRCRFQFEANAVRSRTFYDNFDWSLNLNGQIIAVDFISFLVFSMFSAFCFCVRACVRLRVSAWEEPHKICCHLFVDVNFFASLRVA